jgi:hypothetical protein
MRRPDRFPAQKIITLNEGKGIFLSTNLKNAAMILAVEREDENAEEDRLQLIGS